MNRVDGVILGVGVVVLVASIIGVLLYDETGGTTFEVTWVEGEPEALEDMSDSGGAASYQFTVPVTGNNIAKMVFTLDATVNGVRATPDSVTVMVTGPLGIGDQCTFGMDPGPSGAGTCEVEVPVQDAPASSTVTGADAQAAEAQAAQDVTSDAGNGSWIVDVAIGGGTSAPVAAPSYSITLGPAIVAWTPQAQPPTPDSGGRP